MARSTLPRHLAVVMVLVTSLVITSATANASDVPLRISQGAPINLSDHLVPGKTVIFDFYSAYSPACPCAPCATLGDPMAALQAARDDVVVVRVDINREGVTRVDWNSPVALQFGLRSVPHFKIFGPDGVLVSEDSPRDDIAAAREQVHAMIKLVSAN